jgi:hypothetical protein
MQEKQELKLYLRKLGLGGDEAEIYLDLCEHADSTPLLIARRTEINRTKVYRIIEEMVQEKLVEIEVGAKTTRISPSPIQQLELKLQEKQRRVAELTQNWRVIQEQLGGLAGAQGAETKVKYYKGKSGIEQMVWNVLSAKSEIVGYTTRDLSDFVGEKFMGDFVSEFVRRKLSMRDIYGDEYLGSHHTQYGWGERVQSRRVKSEVLTIPVQMDIYDETVSFYHWVNEEVFGVEIINPLVAQMQKQLFAIAWDKAKN